MEVRFERIAQIVAIAAVCDKSISRYYVDTDELNIKFSDYVKSQVHMNVVYGLYGRSLKEYAETLKFLSGSMMNAPIAEKVLRYFYHDIAGFLVNNSNSVKVKISIDTQLFKKDRKIINLEEIGQKAIDSFSKVESGELPMDKWEYAESFDFAKDSGDFISKASNYVFAHLLQLESNNENIILVESV